MIRRLHLSPASEIKCWREGGEAHPNGYVKVDAPVCVGRVCVGARLAEKELLLYGANLAHCFTWRSPTGEKICKSKMSGLVRHCVSAPVLFTQRRHFEELDK